MANLKIVSYNINGIRAALKKGLADWINDNNFDVILFQEIKADPSVIPYEIFDNLGYQHTWFSAQKKGYSGVGALYKKKPDNIVHGIGVEQFDQEGRLLRLDFGDLSIINSYFPSGSSGDARQSIKMEYLDVFYDYIQKLKNKREYIIASGDYNICHHAIDIHDPIRNKNSSGFLPEERAWMSKYFANGFTDSFRYFNHEPDQYSWWSYRAASRARNKGWRIDYHAISKSLEPHLKSASILSEVNHSDHCPILVEINQQII